MLLACEFREQALRYLSKSSSCSLVFGILSMHTILQMEINGLARKTMIILYLTPFSEMGIFKLQVPDSGIVYIAH